jgi:hypothetical protein
LERLSPKSFCPFVHDVKTTSRAIRFRGPFTVPYGRTCLTAAAAAAAPAAWRWSPRSFLPHPWS